MGDPGGAVGWDRRVSVTSYTKSQGSPQVDVHPQTTDNIPKSTSLAGQFWLSRYLPDLEEKKKREKSRSSHVLVLLEGSVTSGARTCGEHLIGLFELQYPPLFPIWRPIGEMIDLSQNKFWWFNWFNLRNLKRIPILRRASYLLITATRATLITGATNLSQENGQCMP